MLSIKASAKSVPIPSGSRWKADAAVGRRRGTRPISSIHQHGRHQTIGLTASLTRHVLSHTCQVIYYRERERVEDGCPDHPLSQSDEHLRNTSPTLQPPPLPPLTTYHAVSPHVGTIAESWLTPRVPAANAPFGRWPSGLRFGITFGDSLRSPFPPSMLQLQTPQRRHANIIGQGSLTDGREGLTCLSAAARYSSSVRRTVSSGD